MPSSQRPYPKARRTLPSPSIAGDVVARLHHLDIQPIADDCQAAVIRAVKLEHRAPTDFALIVVNYWVYSLHLGRRAPPFSKFGARKRTKLRAASGISGGRSGRNPPIAFRLRRDCLRRTAIFTGVYPPAPRPPSSSKPKQQNPFFHRSQPFNLSKITEISLSSGSAFSSPFSRCRLSSPLRCPIVRRGRGSGNALAGQGRTKRLPMRRFSSFQPSQPIGVYADATPSPCAPRRASRRTGIQMRGGSSSAARA